MESAGLRIALRIWVALVLLFLFAPIVLIVLYAFNRSNIESWPISSFSLRWFSVAWHDQMVRQAFILSVKVGLVATAIAVLLGSAVAYALHTFSFFGREAVSLLLLLPLALPGIITGIALNSFFTFTGIKFSILTIVIGHATFCIVVVFNNIIARLRRVPGSLAVTTLIICTFCGIASGLVGAVVVLMGVIAMRPMLNAGYDTRLAAGVITRIQARSAAVARPSRLFS